MILVITAVISAVILMLSYVKSKSKEGKSEWFGPNDELERFYELVGASAMQAQKQLLGAAVVVVRRQFELEDEKAPVYGLVQSQTVSSDLWELWDRAMKDLQIEKMVISSEAEALREGWSQTIFKEAAMLLERSRRGEQTKARKGGDPFFERKRETLEKKVLARITAQPG